MSSDDHVITKSENAIRSRNVDSPLAQRRRRWAGIELTWGELTWGQRSAFAGSHDALKHHFTSPKTDLKVLSRLIPACANVLSTIGCCYCFIVLCC